MQLLLLRHGKAENANPGGDFARALVEKGRLQSRKVAKALSIAKLLPEIVLTSPLARARQTAEEFCHTAGLPGPLVQGWLACGMAPETLMQELAGFSDFQRVMVVGHEPDLSQAIAWLTVSAACPIEMKKGAVAGLEVDPPRQAGSLKFLVPPALLQE